MYKYQALCIGHNLAFDISRLAHSWVPARKDFLRGWTFTLCDCKDKMGYTSCHFHPEIRILSFGGKKCKFAFVSQAHIGTGGERGNNYAGKFLDTQTLGRALLGPGPSSLAALSKRFKAKIQKSQFDDHGGAITHELLDYNVNDVEATFSLYCAERDLYNLHGVTKKPWNILSEASLGKAYLDDINVPQFMRKHTNFPKEIIGLFMSTYYGGRSEIKLRRTPAECLYVDFKSQYPTVNALQGLQELLLAEEIQIDKNLTTVKEFLDAVTVNDLQHPATWKKLRGICKVIPDKDILPTRTNYNEDSPAANIGINYVSSNLATWYTLADVVASKLLTGKVPHIVEAITLNPLGRVQTKPFKLFGNDEYIIDLNKDDLFTSVIDLRSKVKKDSKQYPKNGEEYTYYDGLQLALKLLANSTSYGVLVEVNPDEKENPECGVVYADRRKPIKAQRLEKTGKYFAGPVGTLIPAGGRLLLAIAEHLGMKRGIKIGMCDTDSSIFIKPDGMTRAEFRKHVYDITAFFDELSPYKTGGSLFEMEDANFNESGELEPLFFYGISTKRYAVFNKLKGKNIKLRGFKEHGLGHIAKPAEYVSPFENSEIGIQWIHDIWKIEITKVLGGKGVELSLQHPVMEQCTLNSTHLYNMYAQLPNIRPFNFFTVYPAIPSWAGSSLHKETGGDTLYSEFTRTLPPVAVVYTRKDNKLHRLPSNLMTSISNATLEYFDHAEAKSTPSNGEGWLERRHVRVIEHVYIGKEYSELHESAMQLRKYDNHPLPLATLGIFARTPMHEMLKGVNMYRFAKMINFNYEKLLAYRRTKTEPLAPMRTKMLIALNEYWGVPYIKQKPGRKPIEKVKPTPKRAHVDILEIVKSTLVHMTPLEMSKRAAVSLRTIYNILNGKPVKVSIAEKIAQGIYAEVNT